MKKKKVMSILVVVFLLGALATYVVPFMSIGLARIGVVEYSFNDMVKLIPLPEMKQGKKAPDIDFMDMLKKIQALGKQARDTKGTFNLSPEIILGALIPIALGLTYLLVLFCLFMEIFGKGVLLKSSLFFSILTSAYVVGAGTYLSALVRNRVAGSGSGVLSIVTGIFSKGVTVQTETGAYALLILVALAFLSHVFRKA